jgi:hypothetical protein
MTDLDLDDLHNDGDLENADAAAAGTNTEPGANDTPPAGISDDDTPPAGNTDDGDGKRPNLADYEPSEDIPAIEQFLSQYGVLGGMIQFEEGEAKHFNDLSEVEKFNVLKDLSITTAPDVAEQYGLDDTEIDLINWTREQNKPIQESIEELAQARAAQILALNNSNSTDFASMDDDAVTMRWLKENDPEASEEDLAEELARQKDSKLYQKNSARLRDQFVSDQQAVLQQQQQRDQEEFYQSLEQERSEIATAVNSIKDVAGFEISDEDKNEILHDLLEVNEYGDSLFMEKVFSDPNELFKAAWFYKNGTSVLDNLEKYYKNEVARAYQLGKTETMNGMSPNPISGTRANNANDDGKSNQSLRKDKIVDIHDLHDND